MSIKRYSLWLCLFMVFGLGLSLFPDNENLRFEHVGTKDGLSQGTIHAITQDRLGYLWFGTEDGLNRYDGYNFKVFSHGFHQKDSISSNRIGAILEDHSGILWIATKGGGLNRFIRAENRFITYLPNPRDLNSSGNVVTCLIEDKQRVLWLGTFRGGLLRFNRDRGDFTEFMVDSSNLKSLKNWIKAIYEDTTGILWVGTCGGIFSFDRSKKKFHGWGFSPVDQGDQNSRRILTIDEDRAGHIWIGTYRGIYLVDRKLKKIFPADFKGADRLRNIRIHTIYEDELNQMWIGTSGGLFVFTAQKDAIHHFRAGNKSQHDISSNTIFQLYRDREKTLWIGTIDGISKVCSIKSQFNNYKINELVPGINKSCMVLALMEDSDGTLWIGTNDEGIIAYDRKRNKIKNYRMGNKESYGFNSNDAGTIRETSNGTIWIGTHYNGFYTFNKSAGKFSHFRIPEEDQGKSRPYETLIVFEDQEKNLWLGNDHYGLKLFNKISSNIRSFSYRESGPKILSHNWVMSMIGGATGEFWITTYGGGLNQIIPRKGIYRHFLHKPDDPNSITTNYLYAIHKDLEGILWIGSNGGGLNSYNPKKNAFNHYSMEDGLPSNVIGSILEDGWGNLWLGSYNGLARFNKTDKSIKNYSIDHGLLVNIFAHNCSCKNLKGEMFFGGAGGFVSFYPQNIKTNIRVPPVVITALKVFRDGKMKSVPMSPGGTLRISFSEQPIFLDFAALSYINPRKNQYAYRLENINDEWIDIGSKHSISFADLDPGEYRLRIKGSNNDLIWNHEGISLNIMVEPQFWQTWWFRVLILLVAAGLLVLWYVSRLKNMKLKLKTELEMKAIFNKKKISKREEEIIQMLLAGKSNKEIEDELFISANTVKNHIYNIYQKLGINNRGELIVLLKTAKK